MAKPQFQPQHQPQPTVCRLVHYVSYGTPGGEFTSECRAAIITEVTGQLADTDQWRVGLFVANRPVSF